MSANPGLATLRASTRHGRAALHQTGPSVFLVADAITGVQGLRCSSAGFAREVYERAGAAMLSGAPITLTTVWHHALYLDAARAHAHRRLGRAYTHDVSVWEAP